MISATKTFTSIKRDISNDQKKYYQLPHKDRRNSPHEFAVLRLMMDQTHGCIHSQGTAEDGYPQKRRFWDTPTMLLAACLSRIVKMIAIKLMKTKQYIKPYLMAFLLKKCHTGGSTGCSTPHCIHSTDNNVAHFAAQNEVQQDLPGHVVPALGAALPPSKAHRWSHNRDRSKNIAFEIETAG